LTADFDGSTLLRVGSPRYPGVLADLVRDHRPALCVSRRRRRRRLTRLLTSC